jgi:hypothetical protein
LAITRAAAGQRNGYAPESEALIYFGILLELGWRIKIVHRLANDVLTVMAIAATSVPAQISSSAVAARVVTNARRAKVSSS